MFFCTKEKAWQKLIASQTLRSNCVSLANKMHDCTTKEEIKKKKKNTRGIDNQRTRSFSLSSEVKTMEMKDNFIMERAQISYIYI